MKTLTNSITLQTGYATNEQGVPQGWLGLDCGEKTNELFAGAVKDAKTILWNG
jgi:phosphoglycerate kinase